MNTPASDSLTPPKPKPGPLPGLFISLEGGEGAGKTTQIRLLEKRLRAAGHEVLVVREPGGTPIGEVVRHLLKHHPDNGAMTKAAELLLFAASRAQLVQEKLLPFLKKGGIVLADRFLDSTTAYQGQGRGLPADLVAAVNSFAVGGCRPHLTFLLDVDSAAGLARARGREPGVRDRMEEEKDAFYATVRKAYLGIAANEPDRVVVIDAAQSQETVHGQVWAALAQRGHVAANAGLRTGDIVPGPGDPCVGGGTMMLL